MIDTPTALRTLTGVPRGSIDDYRGGRWFAGSTAPFSARRIAHWILAGSSLAFIVGCSGNNSDSASSTSKARVSTTTTTARETSTTRPAPRPGDVVWSLNGFDTSAPQMIAESAEVVGDAVLVRLSSPSSSSGTTGTSTGPGVTEFAWAVLDVTTGKQLGEVHVEHSASDSSTANAVLGEDADGKSVLAVRRDVRVPGTGVQPGRTDQLLGLYDVSTGAKRWEVDALLGDEPSDDPNSTSGTRPIVPVGFAGGSLIGYSTSRIPADAGQSQVKAVSINDGTLTWASPRQHVGYVDPTGDFVLSTTTSDPNGTYFGTIEMRDAASGAVTSTKTLPVTESEAFFGGASQSYSTIQMLVELPGNTYVLSEDVTSLDADAEVATSQRVELLDSSLTAKWSMDGVTLRDSPGNGVVVLSTDVYNNTGIGLQGVDATTGSQLWAVSPENLTATDFSLSASISDNDDHGDTRGFVFGSARDETSGGSGSAPVVLDAVSGEQIYVGTSQSPDLDTDGTWSHGLFIKISEDGDVLGYFAPEPSLGISGGVPLFAN